MLTQGEKTDILNDFPNIKLSYETIIHKKVYTSDLLIAVPYGKKGFMWFTEHKNECVVIFLELDNETKKEIKNIKIVKNCFSRSLCYGTIFYGTLFYHLNNPFFSIENIFMYKGNNVAGLNFNEKINKILDILKNEIKQISYNKTFVVFGLPIMTKSNEDMERQLTNINYKISSIQYYKNNKYNSYLSLSFENFNKLVTKRETITNHINEIVMPKQKSVNQPNDKVNSMKQTSQNQNQSQIQSKTNNNTKTFIIKPDIQNDIYHLYSERNDYIGLACIPDYKTSIIMNKLFRIIKENDNLDNLEESDSEDEFENSNIDKYVYLDKSYKMECIFNYKFKKWTPIKITE